MGVGWGLGRCHPVHNTVHAVPVPYKTGETQHQTVLQAELGFCLVLPWRLREVCPIDAVGNNLDMRLWHTPALYVIG